MIAQQLSQKQFVRSRASVHGVVSFRMSDCINERAHRLAALYVGDGSALCARVGAPRMRRSIFFKSYHKPIHHVFACLSCSCTCVVWH
jgi:hypothetical protein